MFFWASILNWQVSILGGNTNNGTNTSTFYWNLNNTTTNLNQNISSRPRLICDSIVSLASWQNTKQTPLVLVGRKIRKFRGAISR